MLLYFAEIFAKWSKIANKKVGIKKIQGVKCQFFSPSSDIFPGIFTMAETYNGQPYNGQRLTSIVQSTNKIYLIKYLFSYFVNFSVKCQM